MRSELSTRVRDHITQKGLLYLFIVKGMARGIDADRSWTVVALLYVSRHHLKMLDPISRRLLGGPGNVRPLVLVYHAIDAGEGHAHDPLSVSLERFRSHLYLIRDAGWSVVRLAALSDGTGPSRPAVAITFDDGYRDNLGAAEALLELRMTATWFVVTGAVLGFGAPLPLDRPSLCSADLREMVRSQLDIGSHSHTHPRLTELDETRLAEEVVHSRALLQDALGLETQSFAYPHGSHDARVVAAVRGAGYRVACTARSGWAHVDRDCLRIRRITVFAHDTASTLARKLAIADNDGSWMRLARYFGSRLRDRIKR